MTQLITNGDLSNEQLISDNIDAPNNVRFDFVISNVVDNSVDIEIIPKTLSGDGDYLPIEDPNNQDTAVVWRKKGNVKFSRNLLFINAPGLKLYINTPADFVGNIDVYINKT